MVIHLLHPGCGRYLPPQLAALAAPPPKAYSAEAMQRPKHDVVAEAREAPAEAAAASNGAAESDDDDEEVRRGWRGWWRCCCWRCAASATSSGLLHPAPATACRCLAALQASHRLSARSPRLPALLPRLQGGGGGGGARPTSGPLGGSKKDPEVRRRELLSGGGDGSLAAALVALCAEQAPVLIRSQHGSDVLVEVCRGGEGGLLLECLEGGAEALAPVHDALVAAVAGGDDGSGGGASSDEGEDGGAAAEPVLSHFFGSRALRRLLLAGGDGGAAGAAAAACAAKLWSGALAGRCGQWVDTHAAKVLAALLHCGDAAVAKAARAELAPLVQGSLDEWADRLTAKQPQAAAAGKQQPKKQQGKQQQQPAKKAAAKQQPPAAAAAAKQPAAAKQQKGKGRK